MLKRLPIGVSDFKKIMTQNCYFADKSMLIKELIDDASDVVLIPRPRRFGKTLNLSMIRYFFDLVEEENLFETLEIWKHTEYRQFKGKYPVVFLTFKDVKSNNFDDCMFKIRETLVGEFRKFNYLLKSKNIDSYDKDKLKSILNNSSANIEFESSLKLLTHCLELHHNAKPVLLIDEYDAPIHAGFTYGFYDKIIDFMRNFLDSALKDNQSLHKAVLTGILRVAKESIFSGLNNLMVATILQIPYSERFGFCEKEVSEMLAYFGKSDIFEKVKAWYNGYIFGLTTIYNPWSLLNFINSQKIEPEAFWINTSSNDIIKSLMKRGTGNVKEDLEILMQGSTIVKEIDSSIVMPDIEKSSDSLWSFMLFSGYLKALHQVEKPGSAKIFYELAIPNREILYLMETIVSLWFKDAIRESEYDVMIKSLISADFDTFDYIFSDYAESAFSYFDTAGESEKTYHAFVLGMLISLPKPEYSVKSNRESGYGRYDVMVIPSDTSKNAIIIEFKKVHPRRGETLESAVDSAFVQMETKNYRKELKDAGFSNIFELAVAIDGKKSVAKGRRVT